MSEDERTPEARVFPERVPAAAVTVISPEPLKETPLMRRAVCRTVAEPALPETVPVTFPVRLPVAVVKKRFVVEAVVAKKLVVVADVPVAVVKVRAWRVEEPVDKRLPRVARPELLKIDEKSVELKKFVDVALVLVEFLAVKF